MNFFEKTFIYSLILFFAGVAHAVTSVRMVDKIVAVVNKDIILYSEFQTYKKGMEEEIKKSPQKDELKNPQSFEKKVLNQKIEDLLLDQQIKLLGLEATDAQVENAISEVMKNNGLQNKKALERALKAEGLNYDEFAADYRKRISRSNLVNQYIRPKIKISEDEIRSEYQKRAATPSNDMEYRVSMIFIPKNHISEKEMEKLRKSIQSAEDFAKIANAKTEGPGAGKGGEIGWINANDLQNPLNEALKKMKKDEISSVLKTDSGYYILICQDQKQKGAEQDPKIRAEVEEELFNMLIVKNLNQYIMDLRRNAHIETFI